MEPGGSMPHSQGLSNNSYPEPNQPNYNKKSIAKLNPLTWLFGGVQIEYLEQTKPEIQY